MDYDNYTVGGSVYAELDLDKIQIEANFSITYTDAYINSKNATHIRVRILFYSTYTWYMKRKIIYVHDFCNAGFFWFYFAKTAN